MPPTVPAAFPFIEVKIDTSALQPVAQRSPGVIAIVGTRRLPATPGLVKIDDLRYVSVAAGAGAGQFVATIKKKPSADAAPNPGAGGDADNVADIALVAVAPLNVPFVVDDGRHAAALFGLQGAYKDPDDGDKDKTFTVPTALSESLRLAFLQDPRPSKVYGVLADTYANGLSALEAADDVTFVSLADETNVNELGALKQHVENMSAEGQKRLGVAMVDPTRAKSLTYVNDAVTAINALKSSVSRMVVVAARGATQDTASAAMAAMAGYEPHISLVLKKIRGVTMPVQNQYSPAEIKGLSEAGVIPIIDPALIVGDSLHFAEGRAFTSDASLLFVDIVRVLDDIDFRLKAGLIGMVGDARITKSGLTAVKTRGEGILGPLQRRAVIDAFNVEIPVLAILNLPESAWTATEQNIVVTARANREIDLFVTVTYGPAIHRLKVTLAPKF
jgi:hypothetical protein